MKVALILFVALIFVNFSLAKDSPKAKKAQNEAKAIINKLKSQGAKEGRKLKNGVNAQAKKFNNEMTKVENTISAEYKKMGVEGRILADIFKGNLTFYLALNAPWTNVKTLDTLLNQAYNILRGITIDPVLGDIQNLTIAINKNSANYNCFGNQKKTIQSIAQGLVKQVDANIVGKLVVLKANMTSIISQIEAIRKKDVSQLKACNKDITCGQKHLNTIYFNGTYQSIVALEREATTLAITSTFNAARAFATNKSIDAVAEYQKQKTIIVACIK